MAASVSVITRSDARGQVQRPAQHALGLLPVDAVPGDPLGVLQHRGDGGEPLELGLLLHVVRGDDQVRVRRRDGLEVDRVAARRGVPELDLREPLRVPPRPRGLLRLAVHRDDVEGLQGVDVRREADHRDPLRTLLQHGLARPGREGQRVLRAALGGGQHRGGRFRRGVGRGGAAREGEQRRERQCGCGGPPAGQGEGHGRPLVGGSVTRKVRQGYPARDAVSDNVRAVGDTIRRGPWSRAEAVAMTAPWRVHVPPVSIPARVESDKHVLLWQVRGRSDFDVDGEARRLDRGFALWVPVGTRHAFTTHANSVLLPMFFEVAETATTLRAPTVITVDRDLRTLFLAFVQSTYSIIRPHANIARQILALIEERPVLVTALPMPTSEAALIVAEALRFNPGDDRGVDELAESAHASTRTIERAFLAETGMTLRQWRIRNRMEAAGILLRARTTPDAVARRVGYANTSAFRRVFKGHFGITPSQYIARFRVEP
jgi:AraC-like DNA-binding protein